MSEGEPEIQLPQDAQPDATPQTPPDDALAPFQSAGALLRQMRQDAGADATLLASALKVSPRKLQALEEDRLEDLPDLTFARGLALAVCRTLGVDPVPVLERLPTATPRLHVPDAALNQRLHHWSEQSGAALAGRWFKPLLIAAAVLALAAAALWLLLPAPHGGASSGEAQSATDRMVHESVAPAPASQPAFMSASADEPDASAATESMPAPAPAPVASESMSMPAPVASATMPTPVASAPIPMPASSPALANAPGPVPAPAVPAPAPVNGAAALLGLTAIGETWVAVRDASGQVLLNRTLSAGEKLGVNGQAPLSVTVGRKEAVTVTVRGQPLSLKSSASSSVARFTVQ